MRDQERLAILHHNILIKMLPQLEDVLMTAGFDCSLALHDRYTHPKDIRDGEAYVTVTYGNSHFRNVNITGDSALAVIIDLVHRGFM